MASKSDEPVSVASPADKLLAGLQRWAGVKRGVRSVTVRCRGGEWEVVLTDSGVDHVGHSRRGLVDAAEQALGVALGKEA